MLVHSFLPVARRLATSSRGPSHRARLVPGRTPVRGARLMIHCAPCFPLP
ncbi:MAG: hypothetical protein OZSIB_1902 [Candidatus Ozemobacter sibiricus]|uniref:Uncharacterized protein n=1 Tax=Candidatus Ozemobacter sibiricus TaxID=2268124 RepID=A0A367ZIN4_9BACT|nr:MAG: hypothetical protein OZSIB_1902 [Candidatus Ozemobacter sibiricus]